ENKRVTCRPPENGDQPGYAETLRQHGQHVFCPDEPAVKERQTWQRHEEHQRGARHHPCVVTRTGRGDVRTASRTQIRSARRVGYIPFKISPALLERRPRLQGCSTEGRCSRRRRRLAKHWTYKRNDSGQQQDP